MKTSFASFTSLFIILAITGTKAVSQTDTGANKSFEPYKLVGDWDFINSNTGRKFGGNIEVSIKSMEANGTMHGLISYDGRQTNDNCGTKPLFTDTPVEAEITKSANDYRIAFQVNCSSGISPRLITWTFTCDDKGDCKQPEVLAWGRGRKLLREVR